MHRQVFILKGKSYLYGSKSSDVETGISSVLKKFENLKVLIIGDVMVDSYVWGKVTRVSPEAPVPVVMHTHTENRLGGAANVALNVKSLGAVPVMCSVIGADENSKIFRDLILQQDMPDAGLIESADRITTSKTRIIAGHQQLLRVDQEVDDLISEELESALWHRIQALINQNNIAAIVFQDYDKGIITPGLINRVISLGNSRKIPTLVDPKRRNFAHYREATLFKPNFKELSEGMQLDMRKSDFESVHAAAMQLQKKAGFSLVLVTLSERGMLLSKGNEYQVVPTQARDVADVSGAGDTVIATASLCLAIHMEPYDMARLANLAAGLVCERVGVVPVEKEWLLGAEKVS
jgi:D-glycero-beta-D-manno-heptose-7-phosphate kinase